MTQDEIIRMAREAGLGTSLSHGKDEPRVWIEGADWHTELERFAALVVAAERERLTWTDARWTEYERGIVATERERIAAWVDDMCAGLDAKTIANGIRNGGNDDMRAFEVKK